MTKAIVGWVLTSFGLLFLAVEIDDYVKGTSHEMAVGLVLAGGCLFGGISLIRKARAARIEGEAAQKQLVRGNHVDTVVIQMAKRQGGKVTANQIAADTPLSYLEAEEILKQLAHAGACHLHVSEKGVKVYHFPEFGEGGAGKTFV